jgi:hypothetical protein
MEDALMLRVSHDVMTLSVDLWRADDVPRAMASGYRPVELINPDSPGEGRAYVLTQSSDHSDLAPIRDLIIQMDAESSFLTILGRLWADLRWVGCNSAVYALSSELEVRRRIDLGSPFADFYLHVTTGQLILVAEVGMTAISIDGNVNWALNVDLISGINWGDRTAKIVQFDQEILTIDLLKGNVIS